MTNLQVSFPVVVRRAAIRLALVIGIVAAMAVAVLPAAAAAASCSGGSYLVSDLAWIRLDEQAARPQVVGRLAVPVNAIGYEPSQGKFYGIGSYPSGSRIVTIDPGGRLTELGLAPPGTGDAYAGTISDGRWYLHALGDLYIVDVDPSSAGYLDIVATRPLSRTVDLGDWDLNPHDGLLYGIEATGAGRARLTTVDPATGAVAVAAATELPGTEPYGAVVLSSARVLHALLNSAGTMYHLPLHDSGFTSSDLGVPARSTDAAGCPAAWDFGDAPDSYGTSLAADGAVHSIDGLGNLAIGQTVDTEPDGQPAPDASADLDDGLTAPVTIAVGAVSISVPIRNRTGAPATVACWLDLDGDGRFRPRERVQREAAAGDSTVTVHWTGGVTTPAATGFLRVRLYPGTVDDPRPTGPATGGEVEDHQVRFRWPKAPAEATDTTAPPATAPATTTPQPSARPTRSTDPSAEPSTKETVQFVATGPEPPRRDDPPRVPVPLAVFAVVLVPALAVAARAVATAATRRTRR